MDEDHNADGHGAEGHGDDAHAADGHGADVAYEGQADAHGATGMPQLDPSTFDNQIFWLLLSLVAIYLMVSRVVMPRLGGILATRSGTIANDIAAAEDLRAKAREAQGAYDKALADARAEANRIADETRDAIQGDLDRALAEADARIEARTAESARSIAAIRAEAGRSVEEVARETARELVAAMGGQADDAAVAAAVSRRMGA